MAQVSTTGPNLNVDSDVGLASAQTLTLAPPANTPITVYWISVSPISTASGVQCGFIELRSGITVLGRWYQFFTASAANQSNTLHIPIGVTIQRGSVYRIAYTAVTDATTAAVAIGWAASFSG